LVPRMTRNLFTCLIVLFSVARATSGQALDQADLRITATGPLYATFGDPVPYLLTVENLGPSASTDVAVSVSAPFQVFSSGICSAGFPCALGFLASNQSRTIQVYVQTPYLFCSECRDPLALYFGANVTGQTQDPDLSNNQFVISTILSPDRKLLSVPAVSAWSSFTLIILLAFAALGCASSDRHLTVRSSGSR